MTECGTYNDLEWNEQMEHQYLITDEELQRGGRWWGALKSEGAFLKVLLDEKQENQETERDKDPKTGLYSSRPIQGLICKFAEA